MTDDIRARVARGMAAHSVFCPDIHVTGHIVEDAFLLAGHKYHQGSSSGSFEMELSDPDEFQDTGREIGIGFNRGFAVMSKGSDKFWKITCPECRGNREGPSILAANKTNLMWCTHLQSFWSGPMAPIMLAMFPLEDEPETLVYPYSPLVNAWLMVNFSKIPQVNVYPRTLRISWTVRKSPVSIKAGSKNISVKGPPSKRVSADVGILNQFFTSTLINDIIVDWVASYLVEGPTQSDYFADRCLKCFKYPTTKATNEERAFLALFGVCEACSKENAASYLQARRQGLKNQEVYKQYAPMTGD